MKTECWKLSSEEAAAELEQLLDAKFIADSHPVEFEKWKKENGQRVTDLQMWLLLHPVVTGEPEQGPLPEPSPAPASQDAPPQQLKKEKATPKPAQKSVQSPAGQSKPAPKKWGGNNRKTPAQKLETAIAEYQRGVARVANDPSNRKLRYAASTARSHIRMICRQEGFALPELPELPTLPDPKRRGGRWPAAVMGVPVVVDLAAPEGEIRFEVEDQVVGKIINVAPPIAAPEPSQAEVYAHHAGPEAVCAPHPVQVPDSAPTILRRIRRDFWVLLAAMESLNDRQALRSDLELVAAQAEQGLRLVDETNEKTA